MTFTLWKFTKQFTNFISIKNEFESKQLTEI
jgi:hypothetical protein